MTATRPGRFGLIPMRPRDPHEAHRVASPLELFFDLVFVVAVSIASTTLHHIESEGHVASGVLSYVMVFFAIWWAWMNFTWFASSFDTDDWLYRVMTVLQMAGVLVLAAGVERVMVDGDYGVVVAGYIVMRLAMVGQWLRAAAGDHALRGTAFRYATAITLVQALWVLWLFLAPSAFAAPLFFVLAALEMAVPVWAQLRVRTPSHPHHITERYGLFTLILLGESLLASANAIIQAINEADHITPLVVLAGAALVIVAGMWWIYFSPDQTVHIASFRRTLAFGYLHGIIFAAAGALSSGIEVAVDVITDTSELGAIEAALTTTVPVGLFVAGIWALSIRPTLARAANATIVVLIAVVFASALVPLALVVAALAVAGIVVVIERSALRSGGTHRVLAVARPVTATATATTEEP